MTLALTPATLEAAYEYLRTTLPFRRWKLPHADEVEFHVIHKRGMFADCETAGEKHTIRISTVKVGRTQTLIETMAHEMVHVRLDRQGVKAHHGADFQRCAAQVCRHHGFDPKTF